MDEGTETLADEIQEKTPEGVEKYLKASKKK